MEKPGREPALHDEPAELRARGKRRIEMQRVVIARDLGECADVFGSQRQAT